MTDEEKTIHVIDIHKRKYIKQRLEFLVGYQGDYIQWPRSKNTRYEQWVYDELVEDMEKHYNDLLLYNEDEITVFNRLHPIVGYKDTLSILGKEIVEDKLLRGM